MKIHHISTGGTIVGVVPEYEEIAAMANLFSDHISIEKYLTKSLKIFADYSETAVCNKDSRDLTEVDRKQIMYAIMSEYESGTRKFLITHGTYTMPDTGKFLLENLAPEVLQEVQIVITGSMIPWTVLGSDAPINLGAALGMLLNTDEPRVSICMHGKMFDPTKVEKNNEQLLFEEVE